MKRWKRSWAELGTRSLANQTLRILGIDPGTRITGYGLIEQQGNRLIHIDNGAIMTRSADPLAVRLQTIHNQIVKIIQQYQPEVMAVEEIFFAQNPQSALKLGHARGSAMLAGVNAGLAVHEYTALQVKTLLNLPELAQEDASDALAVAICHANSRGINQQLQRARSGRGR